MEADTKSADKPAFAITSIQDKQGSTIQKGKKKIWHCHSNKYSLGSYMWSYTWTIMWKHWKESGQETKKTSCLYFQCDAA